MFNRQQYFCTAVANFPAANVNTKYADVNTVHVHKYYLKHEHKCFSDIIKLINNSHELFNQCLYTLIQNRPDLNFSCNFLSF